MAPHHLGVNVLDDVGDVELPGLGGEFGVKHDLQQQIAQLVGKFARVAAIERVEHLVGLLH